MKQYFEISYGTGSLIYIVYDGIVHNVYSIIPSQSTRASVIYDANELFKYLQEYSVCDIKILPLFDMNIISMVGLLSNKIHLNRNQFDIVIEVEIK